MGKALKKEWRFVQGLIRMKKNVIKTQRVLTCSTSCVLETAVSGKNTACLLLRHDFLLKTAIILPTQARDNQREGTQKKSNALLPAEYKAEKGRLGAIRSALPILHRLEAMAPNAAGIGARNTPPPTPPHTHFEPFYYPARNDHFTKTCSGQAWNNGGAIRGVFRRRYRWQAIQGRAGPSEGS
jgi:hypothetical protein